MNPRAWLIGLLVFVILGLLQICAWATWRRTRPVPEDMEP